MLGQSDRLPKLAELDAWLTTDCLRWAGFAAYSDNITQTLVELAPAEPPTEVKSKLDYLKAMLTGQNMMCHVAAYVLSGVNLFWRRLEARTRKADLYNRSGKGSSN